jgi:MoxR-like ATPase
VIAEVERAVVGKRGLLEMMMASMLAGGHILLEDFPGLGKTLVARSFATVLGLEFKRIQFTPDLLPGDITGGYIFNRTKNEFELRKGPIFANIVLADEINRASPKTQSALLEAMQEHSVTVRGTTHLLTPPFFVLATQNPIELEGTYPLPEAQLDRFLFNVLLDYLNPQDEMEVVDRNTSRMELPAITACTTAEEIVQFQWLVRQVPLSAQVREDAVMLIRATRPGEAIAPEGVRRYVRYGASVRATQFLCLAAKARALMAGRYHVTGEDLRALALPVLRHRVLTNYQAESDGKAVDDVLREIIDR